MKNKHRKLRTFGLFCPRICKSPSFDSPQQREVYDALLQMGFCETKWQFIFRGQVAGLVLPYNEGKNEVHIRFYKDRIFAEYEVGRSSIAHFFGPFFNANEFVLSLLEGRVPAATYEKVAEFMSWERLYIEERLLERWDFSDEKFGAKSRQNVGASSSIIGFQTAHKISRMFSWRKINFFAGASLVLVSLFLSLPTLALSSVFMSVIFYSMLPKVGQP